MIACVIISIVSIALYYYLWKPIYYWKQEGVPYIPAWPVVGNFANVMILKKEHLNKAILRIYNHFPKAQYCGIHLFREPVLMIRDPELINTVLIKDFDNFVDHGRTFINSDIDPLFGNNLFSLNGEKWRDMRSILLPAFTENKMKSMFGLMRQIGTQMENYLKRISKELHKDTPLEVELTDMFSRFTCDVIATCAFGIEVDSLTNKENDFYTIGTKSMNFAPWRLIMLTVAPFVMKVINEGIVPKKLEKFLENMISETMKIRERDKIIRPDMINLLMQARKGLLKDEEITENAPSQSLSEELLTDQMISSQAFVFFVSGFKTVASAICFAAYELALNPNVQKKVLAEVDFIRIYCRGTLTYEAVQKMKYMDMVIHETLRKYPPVAALDRVCTKPYILRTKNRQFHFQEGDGIYIPTLGLHMDPQYFPNPKLFNPERFSDDDKINIKPCTYMPFGAGPRTCIGIKFALMEAKVALYYMLNYFELIAGSKTEIPPKLKSFELVPKNGLWIGLKPRRVF